MPTAPHTIPIIDIFAGPGGLSEGFNSAAATGHGIKFASVLSIEKDPVACETLRLRSFFHQFSRGAVPEAYYKFVRGEAAESSLFQFPEWSNASRQVWNAELGKVSISELHTRIRERLNGARDWVLLGGPPCQAYSLVGRARMIGVGHAAKVHPDGGSNIAQIKLDRILKFSRDVRHTLYREYLRIVAVHQPALFVMENVKGILSSRISKDGFGERVFAQIRRDLSSPWRALSDDPDISELKGFRKGGAKNYRLYSFVADGDGDSVSDRDFLIRCEEYGIPQARHRVVLLGIREDLEGRPRVLRKGSSVRVRDVISGLPALRSGLSRDFDTSVAWLDALRGCFPRDLLSKVTDKKVRRTISKVIGRKSVSVTRGAQFIKSSMPPVAGSAPLRRWLTDRRLGGVLQHQSRPHMRSDLGRYLFASATAAHLKHSPRIPDWPIFLLPEHRNVDRYRRRHGTPEKMFIDRFKVQIWDEPSWTVTSHMAKDGHYFIHPDPVQCRSLTVREAARLQTFPDNYFLCGNRTQQYHQVGNAVPPFLASQMAKVIAEYFESATAERSLFDYAFKSVAEAVV